MDKKIEEILSKLRESGNNVLAHRLESEYQQAKENVARAKHDACVNAIDEGKTAFPKTSEVEEIARVFAEMTVDHLKLSLEAGSLRKRNEELTYDLSQAKCQLDRRLIDIEQLRNDSRNRQSSFQSREFNLQQRVESLEQKVIDWRVATFSMAVGAAVLLGFLIKASIN